MYALRQPAEALRPHIESYWSVSPDAGGAVDLRVDVYVDARADLVFNFGAPYTREVIGGAARTVARSNLDAQRLRPIRITQRGAVEVCGVRFHVGGVGVFVDRELAAFTDATPDPAEVFGAEILRVEQELREACDIDARARILDAFFLARRAVDAGREALDRALALAVEGAGRATVAELARAAGTSTRQLDRLFARHVGVAPKTLSRVLRFQSALRALMRDPACPLADVAAAAGYFDQSHFVKNFKKFTGGVPRGYRGYFPEAGPHDFAPNVVAFVQAGAGGGGGESRAAGARGRAPRGGAT